MPADLSNYIITYGPKLQALYLHDVLISSCFFRSTPETETETETGVGGGGGLESEVVVVVEAESGPS